MSEWKGRSKGSLLGYKIFIFCLQTFGLRSAYVLLYFVALYYFLFSWESSKYTYRYFKNHQNFSSLNAFFGVYRSYYVFGQTLIDRVLVSSGNREKFTYEFDGVENIKNALKKGNGAVLISAHIGNFELSEYFFDTLDRDIVSHIVTTDSEKERIKNYLEQFSLKSNIEFILIKDDMSHVYKLNDALRNNGLVCITGDRYMAGSKFLLQEFLGEEARFPAGPFLISSRLRAPVLFVYVMKETTSHYHLYAREAVDFHRDEKALLASYASSVENMLKKYPYQWFNYFDFWKK